MQDQAQVVEEFMNNKLREHLIEDEDAWVWFTKGCAQSVWANIANEICDSELLQCFTEGSVNTFFDYWWIAIGSLPKDTLDKDAILKFSKKFIKSSFNSSVLVLRRPLHVKVVDWLSLEISALYLSCKLFLLRLVN